jgi:hypothetical protein
MQEYLYLNSLDKAADLVHVKLHGGGIGARKHEPFAA